MKLISTRFHGFLDYIVGIILIIAPWALGFARGGAETRIPLIVGIVTILYSMLTNYEWGVARVLPMRAHLTLDVIAGIS